jgi:hypothetical protein
LNQLKEAAAKRKDVELCKNREIPQLSKESLKKTSKIQSLEARNQLTEAALKRKQEEVIALRKMQRGPLSNKAAGRAGLSRGKFLENLGNYLFKILLSLQILVICGSFCHCYITHHTIFNASSDHHVVS